MKTRIRRLASSPAAVTFLLAPVIGELISTSAPLPEFLPSWLPLAVLYGCGAILVRELALRWGSGWVGVGLLGAAYGIVEEGLVTRAFFDPTWEDLGTLAVFGRDGGVNWLWATQLTIYHAAISIGVTLAVVGLLFRHRRGEPWVGRRGLVWSGLGVAAWVLAGFGFYHPPTGHLVATWLVVAALVVAAHRVGVRRRRERRVGAAAAPGSVPRPRRFFLLGVGGWVSVMVLPHLFAEIPGMSSVVAWAAMVSITALIVQRALRWSHRTVAWDDRHRFALAFGITAPFVIFGPVFAGPVWGTLVSVATLWAARRLWHSIGEQVGTDSRQPGTVR